MTMQDVEENAYLAALAGLLHDIGKLAQRAGWRSGRHAEVGAEFLDPFRIDRCNGMGEQLRSFEYLMTDDPFRFLPVKRRTGEDEQFPPPGGAVFTLFVFSSTVGKKTGEQRPMHRIKGSRLAIFPKILHFCDCFMNLPMDVMPLLHPWE